MLGRVEEGSTVVAWCDRIEGVDGGNYYVSEERGQKGCGGRGRLRAVGEEKG